MLTHLDISDTAYRISIALDVPSTNDEETEQPMILLNVVYPEAYPDVAPNLDISAPPDGYRHPLLDVSEDKARLLQSLEPTIEESMGMAMVFTLVSTLKEAAESLIAEREAQAQALRDIEARKAEEEENRKFHGTAVTKESFIAWREKFRNEMAEKAMKEQEDQEAEDKKKRGRLEERKLTGKQLWETGMVGKVDDEEDVDGEDALDGVEKLKIAA
jgi:hypothetical protein